METMRDAVSDVMQALHKKRAAADSLDPEALFKKIFTKKELKHVRFNYFTRGTLSVSVDSSSWLYYLSLQKEALLVKLSKHLSGAKDIRFYLGDTP